MPASHSYGVSISAVEEVLQETIGLRYF